MQHILVRGLEVGVWVAFGYLTQAIGLQDTQVRARVCCVGRRWKTAWRRRVTLVVSGCRAHDPPFPNLNTPHTQASKSAFICSLSVVVVPIVNAIVYKKRPPPTTWLASILAVIGVGMLTLEGACVRAVATKIYVVCALPTPTRPTHSPPPHTPHHITISPSTPSHIIGDLTPSAGDLWSLGQPLGSFPRPHGV